MTDTAKLAKLQETLRRALSNTDAKWGEEEPAFLYGWLSQAVKGALEESEA